jgi:hypothetical protein
MSMTDAPTKNKLKEEKPTEVTPSETLEQKQKRIETCVAEVNQVLEKYNCSLFSYMIVTGTGNVPKIEVISK